MFDFNEKKLTVEQVMNIARQDGLSPVRIAINANGYRQSQRLWCYPDASSIEEGSELAVLISKIRNIGIAGKGVIKLKAAYEGVRKLKPFVGRETRLHQRLQEELIPELEKMNLVCLIGDKVYAHPAILESGWEANFKVYEGDYPSRLPYHLRYTEEEVEMAMDLYRRWNAVAK